MKVLKSLATVFAMYSRIPVPRVEWKPENMSLSATFLPLVGAVIAGLEALLFWVCGLLGISPSVCACLAAAIPILVTGGIHLDGFMDTKDALNSYKPKEEKLKILKDSRIGAFAVIRLVLFFLIFIAAAAELASLPLETAAVFSGNFAWIRLMRGSPRGILLCTLAGFVLSRILAAVFLLFVPKTKNEGFAYMFASASNRRVCGILLAIESVLIIVLMLFLSPLTAIIELLFMAVYSVRFLKMADREFGGLSGDLLGMAITELELLAFLAGALVAIF
ncbi:MAG: adenosylcobinamide-GDP ribazoletransferase [bacterium]